LSVGLTEPLGNETLVFFAFAGRDWVSRMLNPRPLASGTVVPVTFDLTNAHCFDAESGKALARMGGRDGQD
jgi:multiple sugar transport system ATP-binding protein